MGISMENMEIGIGILCDLSLIDACEIRYLKAATVAPRVGDVALSFGLILGLLRRS